MKRAFSSLLASALFIGQTALPVAHEWRVARDEAGHHLQEVLPGPVLDGDADAQSNHAHHGDDCRVCPSVSQLRQAAAQTVPSFLASVLSSVALPSFAAVHPGETVSAHNPRGPPPVA